VAKVTDRKMKMTNESEKSLVAVTKSGEFVRVRTGAEAPGLFQSTLDLPGGTITYDVRYTSIPPDAAVHDPDGAAHWLARVYGAPVAEAILSLNGDGASGASSGTEVEYSPDESASALARIALGQWVWRFWPATSDLPPIDEAVLRFELAALAWGADDYFTALQPASTFLAGTLETLQEVANTLVSDPRASDSPLGRVVLSALDAAVAGPSGALVTEDEHLLDSLEDLFSRLRRDQSIESESPEVDDDVVGGAEEWLQRQSARRRGILADAYRSELALAAGGGDEFGVRQIGGHATVDWVQVPPRTLDWNDGTVDWTAEPTDDGADTWKVTVRVAAAPPLAPTAISLVLARGYILDGTATGNLPVMTLPLALNGDHFLGVGTLQHPRIRDLVIDIFAASSVRPPAIGADERAAARRERSAAREFIRFRYEGRGDAADGPERRFQGEPRKNA
jgi:hypothetical protein